MVAMAQILVSGGAIARKTVKQTVMTSVYGVTWIGGRDQIIKQLKVLYPEIDREMLHHVSGYLVTVTFHCLGEMFNQANKIKSWLSDSGE